MLVRMLDTWVPTHEGHNPVEDKDKAVTEVLAGRDGHEEQRTEGGPQHERGCWVSRKSSQRRW